MQTTTELVAGRELDALIAEKVMGVEYEWHLGPSGQRYALTKGECLTECGRYERAPLPAYSTDIAAAWQVVGRMEPLFKQHAAHGFRVERCPTTRFSRELIWAAGMIVTGDCGQDEWSSQVWAQGETAPLAICRAALAAVTDWAHQLTATVPRS